MTWLAIFAGLGWVLALTLVGVIFFQMTAVDDPYDGESFEGSDDDERPSKCVVCRAVATRSDDEAEMFCDRCFDDTFGGDDVCNICGENARKKCEGVWFCEECFDKKYPDFYGKKEPRP